MDAETSDKLRAEFPPNTVGKLPKGGMMLDFVGHAAVTDRLLSVDPEWKWEPFATDEQGLPALDAAGNLWIRLTVGGVTRIGVGDGKNMKERIGDALRNAAMRFGVALALWTKDELESGHSAEEKPKPTTRPDVDPVPALKRRVAAAAGWAAPAGTDIREWIPQQFIEAGLDPDSAEDLLTMAHKWEAK